MNIKANFLTKYFTEVKTEMKKVIWPTKKTTINHTILVIAISVAVAVFLGMLDFIFSSAIQKIIINY